MRILEAAGYRCTRAAGSLGLFDVVAVGATDIRLIQVKCGSARLSLAEREAIAGCRVPPAVSREYWRFPPRARVPIIEAI